MGEGVSGWVGCCCCCWVIIVLLFEGFSILEMVGGFFRFDCVHLYCREGGFSDGLKMWMGLEMDIGDRWGIYGLGLGYSRVCTFIIGRRLRCWTSRFCVYIQITPLAFYDQGTSPLFLLGAAELFDVLES